MNLIKSHKIVAATLLIGVIGSAVGLAAINQPVENQFAQVDKMVMKPEQPNTVASQIEEKPEATLVVLPEEVPAAAEIVVVEEQVMPIEEAYSYVFSNLESRNEEMRQIIQPRRKYITHTQTIVTMIMKNYPANTSLFKPSRIQSSIDACLAHIISMDESQLLMAANTHDCGY